MSRLQGNLGRGLDDLIGEVSRVNAVPVRTAPPPARPPGSAPMSPPPVSRRGPLVLLGAALLLALAACAVLAWKVRHPAPVAPVVIQLPAPEPIQLPPAAPPRDTRLDWARNLAVSGVKLDGDEARVRLVFDEPVFRSRDQLRPGAEAVLRQIAAAFAPHAGDCVLVVAGHTDNDPPKPGGPYRDNVALGYLRALAAADVLRSAGIPPSALRVMSPGEQSAPYPNADAAGRQRNRTVTLRIESAAGG